MRRRALIFALLMAIALALASCGGFHPHIEATHGSTGSTGPTGVTVVCPPGNSFMGCAAPHQVGTARNVGIAPVGCKFPDVSVYQGHPDWAAVKAWQLAADCPAGAVFKLGEYVQDVDASYNAGQLHALGMAAIGYWFVRNTGCAQESAEMVAVARALGIHVVALDMEVPEAAGYAPCLSAALHAAGMIALIYTGPGTWPGGSSAGLPFWEANYGPASIIDVPSMFGERPIAWQETDGHFGFPVDVPGIGTDDVSIDFGLLRLAAPAPPAPSKAQVAKWKAAAASSDRAYLARGCDVLAQRDRWFSGRLHGHLAAKHRRALRATERAYAQRDCAVFAQRAAYFTRKARS
jgi:hypothetical protein